MMPTMIQIQVRLVPVVGVGVVGVGVGLGVGVGFGPAGKEALLVVNTAAPLEGLPTSVKNTLKLGGLAALS